MGLYKDWTSHMCGPSIGEMLLVTCVTNDWTPAQQQLMLIPTEPTSVFAPLLGLY